MSDESTKIILGRDRFKGAINVDTFVSLPVDQSTKLLTEYDRSVDLNLEDLFDEEQQSSTIFRPVTKYTILFSNALTGSTTYTPFRNNLYYTNELQNTITAFPGGNIGAAPPFPPLQSAWQGFPQYFEFDFIRTDNNVVGYTQPPNAHIDFKNASASTYNWFHYISYPFENIYNRTMNTYLPNSNVNWSWIASQGIPFIITVGSNQNTRVIRFKCPMPHGLTAGEYVELSFNYNQNNLFQVSSLGDNGYGSDEFIFNIANVGFVGNTFNTNVQGTFKRVININNINETRSEYYVRRHKIITNPQCSVLTNAGFEQNIFNSNPKFEIGALTPLQQDRSSVKENSQSYSLSFNCDIDISLYRDNQKRPLTQLFFTTIWRGFFGWTRNMKQGWYFNTYLRPNAAPQPWWDQSNPLSSINNDINQLSYNVGNAGPFYYNETLVSGDTLDGDYCEWNNYDQNERIISDYVHKIKFNGNWFSVITNYIPPTNQYGYFYSPHAPIQIREFSNYVEEGSASIVVDIPDYAYFSKLSNSFRWRDIYPYGYSDEEGIGVNYPFLNGKHYPYVNTIFRITPENFNIISPYTQGSIGPNITTITDPVIDECE
jgi:hypothetical protein